jgi:hypothetical protein
MPAGFAIRTAVQLEGAHLLAAMPAADAGQPCGPKRCDGDATLELRSMAAVVPPAAGPCCGRCPSPCGAIAAAVRSDRADSAANREASSDDDLCRRPEIIFCPV